MTNNRRRVVVTGMGTVNPIAKSLDEYWSSLIEGKSGAAPIEGFSTDRLATKFACQVRDWDPLDHMDRRLVQRSARFTHLAVAASRMAVDDAGLEMSKEDPYRVGIELGTGIGGFDMMTTMAAEYLHGGRLHPLFATMVIPNIAAAQVAMQFGMKGQNSTIVTACAASTHAMGTSMRAIREGHADVMLAAGTEASLCETGIASFNAIKALSTRNDDIDHASGAARNHEPDGLLGIAALRGCRSRCERHKRGAEGKFQNVAPIHAIISRAGGQSSSLKYAAAGDKASP